MIYTVTFNPALDYVIAVDHFAPGQINRTKEETMVCGGKGINVSALLANLGYESTALGFVAGFTGEEIVRRCQKAGFHSDFIRVKDGLSRINVKMKSDEETEINGIGAGHHRNKCGAFVRTAERAESRRHSGAFRKHPRPVSAAVFTRRSWNVSRAAAFRSWWMRRKRF